MDERKRVNEILKRLDEHYGRSYLCCLNYETPWQLLFAVILSAQCRDERVNQVTEKLFVQYPSLEAFAGADLAEMETQIHSLGFYHNKARNLIASARILLTEYGGRVARQRMSFGEIFTTIPVLWWIIMSREFPEIWDLPKRKIRKRWSMI